MVREENNQYRTRAFHQIVELYNRQFSSLFQLSGLSEADVAMVPVDWEEARGGTRWRSTPDRQLIAAVQSFSHSAVQAGKPVFIFFSGERSHEPVPVPGSYVFRNALYRSRKLARDFAMPTVVTRDIQREFPDYSFAPRAKRQVPVVGFCGFSRSVTALERMKAIAYKAYVWSRYGYLDVSPYRGLELRTRCVREISKSTDVNANFIVRSESVYLTDNNAARSRSEQFRKEFAENMVDSDYQLCVRGSANFAFRTWETLCCARIPLYVDTDCVLPFEDLIDWPKLIFIIDQDDLENIPASLAGFHSAMSEEQFIDRQRKCRQLWEEWSTPHGFAQQIHRHFREIVDT